MKKMLFVTSSYPFGMGEASFIRPEIAKLSEKFDITIVSRNNTDEQTSQVPQNAKVLRYNSNMSGAQVKCLIKTIFTPYFYGEIVRLLKTKRLNTTRLKKAFKYCMRSFHFADYLKKIRKDMGENVVLYTYWNDYPVMAFSLIKRKGDKIVSRAHRIDLYETKEKGYYLPLKEIANRKTDLVVFISEQGRTYFTEHFKTKAVKELFRLGVKSQTKNEINTKTNELSVYSFSYVVPVKRLDKIVDALQQIPENIKISWTHIGGGELIDDITKIAREKLDCKDNITYSFTGAMENKDALEFIGKSNFDLLINTSDSEGLPVTMMEAMSFGIPVLGLDVGGVNEIIKNGENGYLLPADAPISSITNTLVAYAKLDFIEVQKMHDNAYEMWRSNFHDDNNYEDFAKRLYNL